MDPNKKARIDSNHPGIPASLGFANPLLKRMQQEEPEEEERSPQKKIMYVPPPTRLEPLRMATRRANVVQLLTTPLTDPRYMGRRPTLQEAYDMYTQMYQTDYDITQDDFNNIASFSIGGKIRRRKKHVYSYKKRSINKKRAKSMKKKRS